MAGSLPLGKVFLAPSLLSADPLSMAESIVRLGDEHDWLHLDIMDGHFVPNLSYGPALLKALRKRYPEAIIDTHLMVTPPEDFIEPFAAQKPDYLTVHVEATPHIHRVLQRIRDLGCRPGVSLNPGTPVEWLRPILHLVDLVLVMSVNPGFGGQSFIPEVLSKVKDLCCWRAADGLDFLVEMDGGLGVQNIARVVEAGCDVVVAGSAVFGTEDPAATLRLMRQKSEEREHHVR